MASSIFKIRILSLELWLYPKVELKYFLTPTRACKLVEPSWCSRQDQSTDKLFLWVIISRRKMMKVDRCTSKKGKTSMSRGQERSKKTKCIILTTSSILKPISKRWKKIITERRGCSSSWWNTNGIYRFRTTRASSRSNKESRQRYSSKTTRNAPLKTSQGKMASSDLEMSGKMLRNQIRKKSSKRSKRSKRRKRKRKIIGGLSPK